MLERGFDRFEDTSVEAHRRCGAGLNPGAPARRMRIRRSPSIDEDD